MLPQPRRTSEDTCPAHVLPPRTPTGVHPPPRARPPPRALPPRVHSRHACTPATRALPPRVHSRHACTPATRALPPRVHSRHARARRRASRAAACTSFTSRPPTTAHTPLRAPLRGLLATFMITKDPVPHGVPDPS